MSSPISRPEALDGGFYYPERAADFNARHKGRRFTKQFNTALEDLIRDPNVDTDCRVLACYQRQAWGNFSDCAVDDETGMIGLMQTDIARMLDLSSSTVNRSVRRLQERNRLRMDGRDGYPVIDPSEGPFAKPSPSQSPEFPRGRTFGEYFDSWLKERPAEADKFSQASSIVSRIRSQALAEFKASQDLHNGAIHPPAINTQPDSSRVQPEVADVGKDALQAEGTENDASYIRSEDLINAPIEAFSPISRASEPEPPATPERETKTYSNEPEQTKIRGSGYEELIELATAIPIRFTRPETPRIREVFARLTIEDRLHAVQRLREYKAAPPWDPGYEPSLIRYLEDQRWTAIFVPKKRKQAVELLTLEELEDAE